MTAELDDLERQMFAIANQNEALERGMKTPVKSAHVLDEIIEKPTDPIKMPPNLPALGGLARRFSRGSELGEAERHFVNPLLTAELDMLEREMFAIASQNEALEKEMKSPEDSPPQSLPRISSLPDSNEGSRAAAEEATLAAFRAACDNFAARARTLARRSPKASPVNAK